ncbi:MAG: BrnA antitoxin family protein [Anaerolineae bacterium]
MNRNSISRVSQTDWETLDKMSDDEIDLSDIPEITAEQMAHAQLRVGGKPISKSKLRINIYLDTEVIEYFKARAGGRSYQTLINETLKESMQVNRMEEILRRVIREELQVQE